MSTSSPATSVPAADRHRPVPWWLLAGAGVLTQLLTMASGIMAARMLGVEGRGQVLLVATLGAVAAQLSLGGGLPNAITKQLAERGIPARDGLRGLARSWLAIGLAAGAVAAAYFVFVDRDRLGVDTALLAVAVVLTAVNAMAARILMGAMLGEGTEPVRIALTGVLPQAAVVVAFGICLAFGWNLGPVGVPFVILAFSGGVLLARIRSLRPSLGPDAPRLDRDELRGLARRGHVSSVGPIDGLQLDRFLVGSLLGNTMLGLYGVASALSALHNVLGMSLAGVALPRLAVLQTDPAAEREYVRRTLTLTVVLMVVITVPLELAMEPLVRWTFGSEFVGAVECARWVVFAACLLGTRRVLIAVLQARDHARYASVVEFVLAAALAAGIVVAALNDSIVLVGILLTAVAVAACLLLGFGVLVTTASGHVAETGSAESAADGAAGA
ncbi:lipopolysaccharide biosynthesis protein [Nocardioides sp. BYT-33-1]|uniref:lipopolysaccharide biosynthesis protein n=1 Tax=Nocardioides sp. BYT-33-1 TaxID=3416952 RepID=UPI003F52C043